MTEHRNNYPVQLFIGLIGVLLIGLGGLVLNPGLFLLILEASAGNLSAWMFGSENFIQSSLCFMGAFALVGFGLLLLIWSRPR